MDLVDPKIDRYVEQFSRWDDPVVREMEALARERRFPIVGPQVGRLLYTFTRAMSASRVLELGSGFGYSAYYFARAIRQGGVVVLTETDEAQAAEARDFLNRAGLGDRVKIEVGDGIKLAGELTGPFDIVFNDVEKEDYPAALAVAREQLRPGGLFICDNMLWYGRVLDPDPGDGETQGVVELSRELREATDFVTSLIPMRDGVTVSVKV